MKRYVGFGTVMLIVVCAVSLLAQTVINGYRIFVDQSADPAAPAAGRTSLYSKGGALKSITNGEAAKTVMYTSTVLAEAQEPAHDGDVTNSQGDLTLALAAKYKTWQSSFKIWGSGTGNLLQATDDELDIFEQAQSARTITRVVCKTDADATTLMIQKDDGSAADMFASAMTCNSTPSGTDGTDGILTSFVEGENALAQGVWLDALVVSIAGGTGHTLSITFSGTID